MAFAPGTVTVVGAASLSQSQVTLSPPQIASGATATVTLVARDANGYQEPSGGLKVTFTLKAGTGVGSGTLGKVNDNKDGTYTVTFTATAAGNDTITATIGGKAVTSAPAPVTVVPAAVSLSKSTVAVSASQVASGGTVT